MSPKSLLKTAKKGGEVERVYRLLRGWILDCRFRPGDFLPEVEVAAQCKTSRTPIREACNRLAEEKWLSKIQNKGYLVTPISIQDVIEVYQYRKLLECFTAERTAQAISQEEIAELKDLLIVECKPKVSSSEFVEANDIFHRSLARLSRNQRVFDQLGLTLDYVYRLDILSTQRDSELIGHSEILAALEAHDADGAHQSMADHIDRSRDRMLKIFFSGALPTVR